MTHRATAIRTAPTTRLPRLRRVPSLAAVVVAMALGLCACGGGGGPSSSGVASLGSTTTSTGTAKNVPASTSASGASSAAAIRRDGLKFARCMRSQGISNFPDPEGTGGFVFQVGNGLDPNSPRVKAAMHACQKYMPRHTQTPAQNAKAKAQLLAFAECMRSHGVTNFPDPISTPGGGWGFNLTPTKVNETSPTYQAATRACRKISPGAGGHPCGGKRRSSADGAETRRC